MNEWTVFPDNILPLHCRHFHLSQISRHFHAVQTRSPCVQDKFSHTCIYHRNRVCVLTVWRQLPVGFVCADEWDGGCMFLGICTVVHCMLILVVLWPACLRRRCCKQTQCFTSSLMFCCVKMSLSARHSAASNHWAVVVWARVPGNIFDSLLVQLSSLWIPFLLLSCSFVRLQFNFISASPERYPCYTI